MGTINHQTLRQNVYQQTREYIRQIHNSIFSENSLMSYKCCSFCLTKLKFFVRWKLIGACFGFEQKRGINDVLPSSLYG